MSQNQSVISVDLGGTNLRLGAVDSQGQVRHFQKLSSKSRGTEILEQLVEAIREVEENLKKEGEEILGIALGVPGIVDLKEGVVYQSPHFPDWKQVPIRRYFEGKFSYPLFLDNDAHLIARGEAWKGVAQEIRNFILLTLGTGVGGAIVWEGRLLSGDSGFAGEFGHMVIESEGVSCPCGSRGCFEMYVSATGILHHLEKGGRIDSNEKMTVEKLHESALNGDIAAHAAFQRMGSFLGIGIASLVNITGIQTVVLGGGVSRAWDFFIEPAKKEIVRRTYSETASRILLKRAILGDEAGLLGGGAVFFQKS